MNRENAGHLCFLANKLDIVKVNNSLLIYLGYKGSIKHNAK